jgi:hypothetical protein
MCRLFWVARCPVRGSTHKVARQAGQRAFSACSGSQARKAAAHRSTLNESVAPVWHASVPRTGLARLAPIPRLWDAESATKLDSAGQCAPTKVLARNARRDTVGVGAHTCRSHAVDQGEVAFQRKAIQRSTLVTACVTLNVRTRALKGGNGLESDLHTRCVTYAVKDVRSWGFYWPLLLGRGRALHPCVPKKSTAC